MKKRDLLLGFLRWMVAVVFLFSGFVKGVDPWGTAIKLREYFAAFGVEWLAGSAYFFSVVLSAVEMILGLCLLFRIRERVVTLWVVIVLGVFTLLTFVLALWNPVADCGCFGDFIQLSNWETFFKNLFLISFAGILLREVRREKRVGEVSPMVEWSMVFCFSLFALGVGIYSMRHLPLIDFLPFRVGVNIPAAMEDSGGDRQTLLIYKDRTTNEQHEFALEDTTWYDTVRWEYVDTRVRESGTQQQKRATILDFSVFDADGDHGAGLLSSAQEVFLITRTRLDQPLEPPCRQRLEDVVRYATQHRCRVVCVTSSPLPESGVYSLGDVQIPVYNMDGTTLKMLIRAHNGLVLLKEGTILGKWNCRDIPRFGTEYRDRTPLEAVIELQDRSYRNGLLGILVISLSLIYVAYTSHKR